jgi:hypothetical protein
VALTRVGYYCGDDEMRWWQFGEATANALKTFQVGGLAFARHSLGSRESSKKYRELLGSFL